MNQVFSLQRIGWLLRKDWIESKKNMGYALVAFLVVVFPFLWLTTHDEGQSEQVAFYILGFLGSFIYFCKQAGKKIHFAKGIYLTLPASTEEKYFTLLLEGALVLIVYNGLFWISIYGWSLINPQFHPVSASIVYHSMRGAGISIFFASLIFLSYLTFKKHALAIAIAGIGAGLGVLIGLGFWLLKIEINREGMTEAGCFLNPDALSSTAGFLTDHANSAMGIFTLIVLYIAYLKLKEKESR